MFFTLFGYWVGGGGGGSQGIVTQPAYAVFHSGQLKIEVFKTCFFDIVTTNMTIPAIQCMFHSQGIGTQPAMQLFTLDSSKIEVFKTYFFDVVTTQYDHPRYVKHFFGRIGIFFTLFGYWVGGGGGGGSQGMGTQPAYAVFHSGQLQNRSFQNLFF